MHTIDRLAGLPMVTDAVAGVPSRTLGVLRRQAEIQLRREDSGQPTHTLVDAIAFGALPPPAVTPVAGLEVVVAPELSVATAVRV